METRFFEDGCPPPPLVLGSVVPSCLPPPAPEEDTGTGITTPPVAADACSLTVRACSLRFKASLAMCSMRASSRASVNWRSRISFSHLSEGKCYIANAIVSRSRVFLPPESTMTNGNG